MIKKSNKLIYVIWIILVIIILLITLNFNKNSNTFIGIAESREIEINFGKAVELKKIHVLSGQQIKKGQLLVELSRPDLTMEINTISHNINEFRSQGALSKNTLISRINQLKTERAAKISDINFQIEQLQNKYKNNLSIIKDLKSINENDIKSEINNPILMEINAKKQALDLFVKRVNINIKFLRKELNEPQNTFKIHTERLKKELEILKSEANKLKIYAQISGVIGSVNYKENEKVQPFSPILTIYTKAPAYIKGYIHENISHNIKIGEKVKLFSYVNNDYNLIGQIIGVGARIVEFPERLRKIPERKLWGREIIVKIPENNNFLLGEKIIISSDISSKNPINSLSKVYADEKKKILNIKENASTIKNINISEKINLKTNLEASGILYLKDLNKYLVISDETDNKKSFLFLMNENGSIEEKIIINGLNKIDDMEAITKDEKNNIYIISSQSKNKKNKITKSRKLLIKLKRNKKNITLDKKISFYDLLKNVTLKNKNTKWAKLLLNNQKFSDINIEGITIIKNDLYTAFKFPLDKTGKSIILRFKNINKILDNNIIHSENITLWRKIHLSDKITKESFSISDLYFYKNSFYLLTNSSHKSKRTGILWQYNLLDKKLNRVIQFINLKPEGIDINKNKVMIVFDNGQNNPSQFFTGKLK